MSDNNDNKITAGVGELIDFLPPIVDESANHILAGRYPISYKEYEIHGADGQKTVIKEPFLLDDGSDYAKKQRVHVLCRKPSGLIKFVGLSTNAVGNKTVVLRFDDQYQLDCWMQFELPYDDIIERVKEAENERQYHADNHKRKHNKEEEEEERIMKINNQFS